MGEGDGAVPVPFIARRAPARRGRRLPDCNTSGYVAAGPGTAHGWRTDVHRAGDQGRSSFRG